MRESEIDINAYFQRISYTGAKVSPLELLQQLIFAHVRSIPFENLDVLLGRKILLDPNSLMQNWFMIAVVAIVLSKTDYPCSS
jgi:N-hydroxyarylamine O-acetyltransferase